MVGVLRSVVLACLLALSAQSIVLLQSNIGSSDVILPNNPVPSLSSNDSNSDSHDFSRGGYHLATGEWWQPPYSPTLLDWDGDGVSNALDAHPTDPVLPPVGQQNSLCFLDNVSCPSEITRINLDRDSIWTSSNSMHTYSIAWGDVDGDGDLDLAVGNGGTSKQVNELFLNLDGAIETTPTWSSENSTATYSVAWGDVDGDGDLDLAVGNGGGGGGGDVNEVYLNSEGMLDVRPTWTSNNSLSTTSIAWGDVDGDGDLDLAVGNRNGDSNEIYLNSNGMLASTPAWERGSDVDTYSIAWGDVNGDGDLDLAFGNYEQNEVYLNSGGSLAWIPAWTSENSYLSYSIAWGDIDGDGDLDLAVGNGGGGATYGQPNEIYFNSGTTLETTAAWTPSGEIQPQTRSIALGDVDNDGDLDLAVANYMVSGSWWGAATNKIYLNSGDTLQNTAGWTSNNAQYSYSIAFGDVDGDGDLELAVGNELGELNEIFLNQDTTLEDSPEWTSNDIITSGNGKFSTSIAWGDPDNDGDLDLAVGNTGDGYPGGAENEVFLSSNGMLPNDHSWSGGSSMFDPLGTYLETYSIAWGDMDGDGDLDLAFGNGGYPQTPEASNFWMSPNEVYLFSNGTLATTPAWTSTNSLDSRSVAWGDVDGDGDLDLAIGNDGASNELYLNNGSSLGASSSWTSNNEMYTRSVAWGDVDGDGDIDLAVGNAGGQNEIYLNTNGMLGVTPVWTSNNSLDTNSVAWGDVDGDGDLDLAVGNVGSNNEVYLNVGGILETTPSWMSDNSQLTRSVAWGDVDGDGDLDLAIGNAGWPGQANEIYLNSDHALATTPVWTSNSLHTTYSVAWGDSDNDGDLDLAVANWDASDEIFLSSFDEDGDWILDEEDEYDLDPTQAIDFDEDGFGDHEFGRQYDSCTGYWGDSWRDRWGCPDMDGDGQSDLFDSFMNKPTQWDDSDGDGLGDNWDGSGQTSRPSHWPGQSIENVFNPDPSPLDFDNDGSEDGQLQSQGAIAPFDDCPMEYGTSSVDLTGCRDSDGDGYSDTGDAFPTDSSQWSDVDHDGFGDNPYPAYQPDDCPTTPGNSTRDRFGCVDIDGDGYSPAADFDDTDPTKWGVDGDGDGYSDSDDAFVDDGSQWEDSDGDGYGDNPLGSQPDACPQENGAGVWIVTDDQRSDNFGCIDSDGDGYRDDSDDCPLSPGLSFGETWGCPDSDLDGIRDVEDDCPMQGGTSSANLIACPDSDEDGIADLEDPAPLMALSGDSTQDDWDGDSHSNSNDVFPLDETQWADTDGDGLGDEPTGRNPDPSRGDHDNDGWVDPPNLDTDEHGCLLNSTDVLDAFPVDPLEWSDFDGDCIGDNSDVDDDNDGFSDIEEQNQFTNPYDGSNYPIEAFQLMIPNTNFGLDGWDLIGICGGVPVFGWLLFGFITRNRRANRFETQLRAAGTKKELEDIALRSEYALMIRLIGAHQGIRLERLRAELDDELEGNADQGGISHPPPPPLNSQPTAVTGPPATIIAESMLDGPDNSESVHPPAQDMMGIVAQDGNEWLQYAGSTWYRPSEAKGEWVRWMQ